MASHGIARPATREERTAEARAKELKEIAEYKSLVDFVQEQVSKADFSPELLQKTAALLEKNPEYYTVWNIRRRIYTNEFGNISKAVANDGITENDRESQILDIINLDLQFLFPMLLRFPKCYWIWNHRIWLLEQSSKLLPSAKARKIWEDELGLVGKMLSRDSRNYHGWSYRRFVVENLESATLQGSSMARSELDYTTKMIKSNLSNFSAWHNRAKLTQRLLREEKATSAERKHFLDQELKLIHDTLFDPYDQSLWFYHQNLMNGLDPREHETAIAPDLSTEERTQYLREERKFILEILEDADDCKWVYEALIECTLLEASLQSMPLEAPAKMQIRQWLEKLKELDPLRSGRWQDMNYGLDFMYDG